MKNNPGFATTAPHLKINLVNTGKRFNREWIFRKLNCVFETGSSFAITGNNGSGKSTLLQIISGAILHSEGEVIYTQNENIVPEEKIHSHFSLAAPYLELIEEMTALELLKFHQSFIPLTLPANEIPNVAIEFIYWNKRIILRIINRNSIRLIVIDLFSKYIQIV